MQMTTTRTTSCSQECSPRAAITCVAAFERCAHQMRKSASRHPDEVITPVDLSIAANARKEHVVWLKDTLQILGCVAFEDEAAINSRLIHQIG